MSGIGQGDFRKLRLRTLIDKGLKNVSQEQYVWQNKVLNSPS